MTIKEIKAQLSILQVLAYYGLEVKKGHIKCPFHDDKTPSMKVYEDTNTVYCFSGKCETHGHSLDVIEFVQRMEKCSKHEAIMKCKQLLGQVPVAASPAPPAPTTPLAKPTAKAVNLVWESLQKSLKKNDKAKAYLKNRGLGTENIGYHSGFFAKTKLLAEAKAVGLVNAAGQSWAKNCVIFPLRDIDGKMVSFYGRSISQSHKGHYYQTGRSGLYPKYPSQSCKRLILTESVIDAASLQQIPELSHYETLALYGTNGLTEEHRVALATLGDLKEVLIVLDGDEAGEQAGVKHQTELKKLLPKAKIRRIELPQGTDVNELWANHLNGQLFVELFGTKPAEETATRQVSAPATKLDIQDPNNLIFKGKTAKCYVKGFGGLKSLDSMKVMLVLEVGDKKARGKVELYEDTAVARHCKRAGERLDVDGQLLEEDLRDLTDELEQYRIRYQPTEKTERVQHFEISAAARTQAKTFLKAPNLFSRLNTLIGKTGIVGEEQTRLLLFVVASSYKCEDPLHALIQGSSGSGKTRLLRKVMEMLPEPDRHIWTRITDKSLYHAGTKYKHSAIAVEDWDGLSEEVQYVIRELQSGKRLSSTSTEKNASGKMVNIEILAEGPISSLMCTTRGAIYEDNMSRCLLVAVDEGEEQTNRILDYQQRKDRGELFPKEEEKALKKLQNMVHVLQPKEIINPFAGRVELPKKVHKIRRLNYLFQCFVKQVTWLHQYQRKADKMGRIIATKEDVSLAIQLLFETIVLKVDELDGSLRQFYEQLKEYVQGQDDGEKYCFTRREIRQALNITKSQQHRYLMELLSLEYVRQMSGQGNSRHRYQIIYWDDNVALKSQLRADLNHQLDQL